jgi:hypothetical protein
LFSKATRRRFDIREVSADAAYLSPDNMNMAGDAGGTPYICFKSNTTAAGGGLMAKMFHHYNLNRDEYLAHYYKRSNLESINMMIKSKFGDHNRSKTDVAIGKEAPSKVLCHNIAVLIQSHHRLGIEPVVWKDDAADEARAAIEANPEPRDFADLMAWV